MFHLQIFNKYQFFVIKIIRTCNNGNGVKKTDLHAKSGPYKVVLKTKIGRDKVNRSHKNKIRIEKMIDLDNHLWTGIYILAIFCPN